MVRSSLALAFLLVACSQQKKIELIPFPDEFYEIMDYDRESERYFLVSGENLYSDSSERKIESLVQSSVPQGKDTFTVCVFKENSWDGLSRKGFGKYIEPFGDEWESVWVMKDTLLLN